MRACRQPAVLEPGEKTIQLEDNRFDLGIHGGTVMLHAWNAQTSLARRILRVGREAPDQLELITRRLGQGEGRLTIQDLARARPDLDRHVGRLEFRERFRRMLARRFGGWEIRQISSAADLEHSLSPLYARALVVRGQMAFAAIGIDESADAAGSDHILSFGLIWLDHLRRRGRQSCPVEGLKLFVPQRRAAATAARLPLLDPAGGAFELFEFGRDNSTAGVGEQSTGNLATALEPALAPYPVGRAAAEWIARLQTRFGVETVARADGVLSVRLRGLEFARVSAAGMSWGFEEDHPVTPDTFQRVEKLAERLAAARSADPPDPQDWLHRAAPEKWLESLVRARPEAIDSSLAPEPIYSQVPALAGVERGVIDLLACDRDGRLVVIELKASQDLHLPLQGLDYWMRVKWHLDRSEFSRRGYFPGHELRNEPPRLLLVSPVFEFHPTTEIILQFLSRQVEVERVGLGGQWRRELKVVFRARGAERP